MKKNLFIEKFTENLQIEVFPVTILKLLLNRKKILNTISKVSSNDKKIKDIIPNYSIDNSNCSVCKEKKKIGINLCRQHTSIERVVFEGKSLAYDIDSNLYLYKNEIFRKISDDEIIIIYCPHTKLITGELTDSKVRKINFIILKDEKIKDISNFEDRKIIKFSSSSIMEEPTKCWFDSTYSIVTLPKKNGFCNFLLELNK